MHDPGAGDRSEPSGLRMAAAVLAGWVAMLLTVAIPGVVLVRILEPSLSFGGDLEGVGRILGDVLKDAGAPALGVSAVASLGIHAWLAARSLEKRLRWYGRTGAVVGALALPIGLPGDLRSEGVFTAIAAAIGALLGCVSLLAFGAVVRRGRPS